MSIEDVQVTEIVEEECLEKGTTYFVTVVPIVDEHSISDRDRDPRRYPYDVAKELFPLALMRFINIDTRDFDNQVDKWAYNLMLNLCEQFSTRMKN